MNTVTRTRYQTRKLLAAKHLDDLMKIYNAGYEDAKPTLKIANKAFDRLAKPLHQMTKVHKGTSDHYKIMRNEANIAFVFLGSCYVAWCLVKFMFVTF